jgi:hypothetical protein
MSQTTYGIREGILTALGAVLLGACQTAGAATLCVNPTGASGCQSTIGKAVSAASSGDTIQVAAGTYKEDVVIKMPLSLIGAGSANTIIDATGLANGIFVDGPDAMGIQNVVIAGFTVQNANFAGILVEKATAITIWNNQILKNNRGLNIAGSEPTCPGLPAALEPGEDQDCGEGLNLSGVDHSVVSNGEHRERKLFRLRNYAGVAQRHGRLSEHHYRQPVHEQWIQSSRSGRGHWNFCARAGQQGVRKCCAE